MATVLSFADKKEDGRFAVGDVNGMPVAYLDVTWGGASFTAQRPDGTALCTGRRPRAFSRTTEVLDPGGAVLATLRQGWATKISLSLPVGQDLTIKGKWSGRQWAATDKSGNAVLSANSTARGLTLRPDAYAVTCDDSLDLATVVGVVETVRLMIKRRRQSASTTGAIAASS